MTCSFRSSRWAIASLSCGEKMGTALPGAHGLAHIHDAHDGHLLVVRPLGQLEQRVFALAAVVVAFQRRRGRAEHDHGAFHLAAHNGDVARVVAGRLLLLVGMLVLLVHDDQAERFDGGEDGRARADGDARAALANLVPLVVPLAGGQMAVQHRHQRLQRAGAEPRLEALDGLRRERDFRHEDNRALALLQGVGDGLQIDLGLAAAGDAVEEEGRGARGEGRGARRRMEDGGHANIEHRTLNLEHRTLNFGAACGTLDFGLWTSDFGLRPSVHRRLDGGEGFGLRGVQRQRLAWAGCARARRGRARKSPRRS